MLRFAPASPEDTETIFQLNKQLIDTYEDVTAIEYDRVLYWVHRNIEENLPYFNRVLRGGQLVGYYCLMPSGKGTELDSFFVLPEYRDQGIGTEILDFLRQTAISPIFLYVFRKNTRAIALYKRMGFRIIKEVGNTRCIMEYQKQGC